MAKKRAHRKLPPLTGIGRQVVDRIVTGGALGEYPGCCSVDDLAKEFKRDPKRFRSTTLKRVADAGYVEIKGDMLEMVYPTPEAIRHQDPKLSEPEAKRIAASIKRKRR